MRFQRMCAAVLSVLTLLPPSRACADDLPPVSAAACVVMAEDGQAVYEKNADARRLIASTTKLMTALICLETCSLEEQVCIRPDHCAVEGSSMYLDTQETYTVRELLLGLLLASGNDAALALADHAAGSAPVFADKMNRRAAALGLTDTHFANPHGLDAPDHYSTARDLARLMLACMDNPSFRQLCATETTAIHGQVLNNHNKLLRICPGCVGGKTGYTMAAGRCLVSCCERGGLRFVCVTLNDPDDWRDHLGLYNWAFGHFCRWRLSEHLDCTVPVASGSRESAALAAEKEMQMIVSRIEPITLRAEIPQFVFAPVKKGETAGKLWVIIGGNEPVEIPLVYDEDVPLAWPAIAAG